MSAAKMAAALAAHLSPEARRLVEDPGATSGAVSAAANMVQRLSQTSAGRAEAVALAAVAEAMRWEEAAQEEPDVAGLAAAYVDARSAALEARRRAGPGYTPRLGVGPTSDDRPRGGDVYSTGEPPVEYVLTEYTEPCGLARYFMLRHGAPNPWEVSWDFIAECWTRRGRTPEALAADAALDVEERALDALTKAVRAPTAAPNR